MDIQSDENIGYWLFYAQRCVSNAFADTLRTCCVEHKKPYVITPPQWGLLWLLFEDDGLTVNAISQQRALDAPTISGIIKRLEQNGLVERCHDRADRRVVKVYITAEGRDIMSFLSADVVSFHQHFLRDFSQAERQDFLAQLQRMVANVSDITLGIGDRFGLLPEHMRIQDHHSQPQQQDQEQQA